MSIKIGGVPATALQLEALRDSMGVPSAQDLSTATTALDTKYKVVRQFAADDIGSHFHTVPYDWRNIAEFNNNVTAMPLNTETTYDALAQKIGHVRTFWPRISQLFRADRVTPNYKRVLEFQDLLDYWAQRGVKVHWVISLDRVSPADTGLDANCTEAATMLDTLFTLAPDIALSLESVEPINEVYSIANSGGWGSDFSAMANRAAKMQRVAYVAIKKYNPNCKVLSCSFQGGEAGVLEALGKASAQTPDILGAGTGAGTTGSHYMDAVSWHPYGYQDTLKEVLQGSWPSWVDYAWGQVTTGLTAIAAQAGTAWYGRDISTIPVWATECNVTMNHLSTKPSDFRFEVLTSQQKTDVLRAGLARARDLGFQRVFLYAADDYQTVGYQYATNVEQSADGEFVLTAPGYLPGDTIVVDGPSPAGLNGTWTTYRVNRNKVYLEGSTYAAGWAADTTTVITKRFMLGGWHNEVAEMITT